MAIRSLLKGLFGESMIALAQTLFLDSKIYKQINNVTLLMPDGTTQIDHVIVSKFGIFVVETKNMKGWIFGDEKSPQWTQSIYGKKFRFQNPLHQNLRHTKCLSQFLGIEHDKIHSVVNFTDECTFKTSLPPNVINHGLIPYIKDKNEVFFTDSEVEELVVAIKTGKLPRTWATHRQHLASLKDRHTRLPKTTEATLVASPGMVATPNQSAESTEAIKAKSQQSCPKCSHPMVMRKGKTGALAGKQFWGCSQYPKCKSTIPFADAA